MASRLNEVLRFLRAERPAVNVESLVLGLQIELVCRPMVQTE